MFFALNLQIENYSSIVKPCTMHLQELRSQLGGAREPLEPALTSRYQTHICICGFFDLLRNSPMYTDFILCVYFWSVSCVLQVMFIVCNRT